MIEQEFDIKDTWLYMGLLAAHEEAHVTKYINEKKGKSEKTSYERASLEYAVEIRSTLRETKTLLAKKALSEKGGQYPCKTLEKLLSLGVISEKELQVMKLRTTMTYYDIGETLKISPSTAFRTVQRIHARVKEICTKLNLTDEGVPFVETDMLHATKEIQAKILLAKLSHQQHDIYRLMCRGYSNAEIALKLGIHGNTVKTQKSRIKKMQAYLNMV